MLVCQVFPALLGYNSAFGEIMAWRGICPWMHYLKQWWIILEMHICISKRPSHWRYLDRIRNSMKCFNALVSNIFGWSQRNVEHVTTVTLSWRVQKFVVIGWPHLKPEHSKCSLDFEFVRNPVSRTGARPKLVLPVFRQGWQQYCIINHTLGNNM